MELVSEEVIDMLDARLPREIRDVVLGFLRDDVSRVAAAYRRVVKEIWVDIGMGTHMKCAGFSKVTERCNKCFASLGVTILKDNVIGTYDLAHYKNCERYTQTTWIEWFPRFYYGENLLKVYDQYGSYKETYEF